MKGIILAGGRATRLHPLTTVVSKQLLPVYNKPLIYYPLSTLMLAGIREILVITTPDSIKPFQKLLGTGEALGLRITYAEQNAPNGIAEAFVIAEDFIQEDSVTLILGDNIYYGDHFVTLLERVTPLKEGACVFAYSVKDPQRYGMLELDRDGAPLRIIEKPLEATSPWAVTGLYIYDNHVVDIARRLTPSPRGELEITDINNHYLKKGQLHVEFLGRGYAWLDTGTYESLLDASMFIRTIEERQSLKISCIEEIAYRKGFITKTQLLNLAKQFSSEYGRYLHRIAQSP